MVLKVVAVGTSRLAQPNPPQWSHSDPDYAEIGIPHKSIKADTYKGMAIPRGMILELVTDCCSLFLTERQGKGLRRLA